MNVTVRGVLLGAVCAALSFSCAYAWSDDIVDEPVTRAGLVDTGTIEPQVNLDTPALSISYDQPTPIENIAPPSLSYDLAGPVNEPVDNGMMATTPYTVGQDMSSNIGSGYEADVSPVNIGSAVQPVDAYDEMDVPDVMPAGPGAISAIDNVQENTRDSIAALDIVDTASAVSPVDDLKPMDIAAVADDRKGSAASDNHGVPAVTVEADAPQVKVESKPTSGDIAQALADASKRGDMITLNGGGTIYKVDSAVYPALAEFMGTQMKEHVSGLDGVKFVDPKQYKNNPELYQNIENGQFYVVDKDSKTNGMSIYKTDQEQIQASDKAGLPLWILTSGIADGSVVQLVDENKKPTNLLVEYKNGEFLNAYDGRESWLKSDGDKASFYKMNSAESALMSSATDPSAVKQAILGAHAKGDEIPLTGGETIYKVESSLYGMLSDASRNQAGAKYVNPEQYKGNPELYQNPENGQLYVVDKDSKTKQTSIYKTTDDQIKAADKAGLPLWVFTSGIQDGTVVQLVDANKQPTNLLIEYKDNIYVNAYDNREVWVKGKDSTNFARLPEAVGNALLRSK